MQFILFAITLLACNTAYANQILVKTEAIIINAYGQNGKNATNGRSNFSAGGNGLNAGNAQAGQNGGAVKLDFSQNNEELTVNILANKLQKQQLLSSEVISKLNSIKINVSGGDGGNGGVGGNGAKGMTGAKGSQCQDGEPGGTGGNGGFGSNGAKAGDGGSAIINIPYSRRELLSLIDLINFAPGDGGKKGSHGKAGQGGDGGPGGHSKFAFSDDDTGCSGGSQGPRGVTGRTPRLPVLKPGPLGKNGQLKINTTDINNIKLSFTDRYQINGSYQIKDQNNDGIFEAGEQINISNFRISNPSGMATPKQPINIKVLPSEQYLHQGTDFVSTDSVAGYTKNKLLPDQNINIILTNVEKDQVSLNPHITKVKFPTKAFQMPFNKNLPEFIFNPVIEQKFPIVARKIQTPDVLENGDIAEIKWEIVNISKKDLGDKSSSKRKIMVRLQILSEENLDSFNLTAVDETSKHNATIKNKIYELKIPFLAAGQKIELKFKIKVSDQTPNYVPLSIKQVVYLDRLDTKDFLLNPIQNGTTTLKVAPAYKQVQGGNVLLVSNKYSSKESIQAWIEMLQKLGFTPEIFDTDYEEKFSLYNRVYREKTLAKRYKNKIVIILNNDRVLKNHNNITAQADQVMLDLNEYTQGVFEDNISFYFVGKNNTHYKNLFNRLVMPPVKNDDDKKAVEYTYKKIHKFYTAIEKKDFSGKLGLIAEIDLDIGSEFKKPTIEKHKEIVTELKNKLTKLAPTDRFYVVGTYQYSENPRFLRIKKYNLGKLKIYKALNFNEIAWTGNPVSNAEMQTSRWINSDQNIRQFIYALNINQKLQLFNRLSKDFKTNSELIDTVHDGVLLELVFEQLLIRSRKKMLDKDQIKNMMSKFDLVIEFFDTFSPILVDGKNALYESDKANFLLQILARLNKVAKNESHWRNNIPLLGNRHERSNEVLNNESLKAINNIFEDKKNIKKALDKYKNAFKRMNSNEFFKDLLIDLKAETSLITLSQSSNFLNLDLTDRNYQNKKDELEQQGMRLQHLQKHSKDRNKQKSSSFDNRVEETSGENIEDKEFFDF